MTIKDKPVNPIHFKPESELRSELARFSRSELVFLAGLVSALITESIIGWSFTEHRDSWFNIALLGLGVIVALCCAGEYLSAHRSDAIQSELDRRTEEKVAALDKEAETLRSENLKLQLQLSPRWLTDEQYTLIQSLRGKIRAVNVSCEGNGETFRFAGQLANALRSAGIEVVEYRRRSLEGSFVNNIYDQLARVNPTGAPTHGEPLLSVLYNAGVYNGQLLDTLPNDLVDARAPRSVPMIMLGNKPLFS